jgi:hypothetical protein
MIDIEHLSDAELDVLAHRYENLRSVASERVEKKHHGETKHKLP